MFYFGFHRKAKGGLCYASGGGTAGEDHKLHFRFGGGCVSAICADLVRCFHIRNLGLSVEWGAVGGVPARFVVAGGIGGGGAETPGVRALVDCGAVSANGGRTAGES